MKLLFWLFVLALYAIGVWLLAFPRAFQSYALKPRFGSSRSFIESKSSPLRGSR